MKTAKNRYQLFKPESVLRGASLRSTYESFPVYVEEDNVNRSLSLDGYEPPSAEDIHALENLAAEIRHLYTLLDAKQHVFTLTAFVLEKLFVTLHRGAYGSYLTKTNFVNEVERLSRSREAVTYVPKSSEPGAVIELDSVVGSSSTNSFSRSSHSSSLWSSSSTSTSSPLPSSSGVRTYGR